MDPSDQDVSFDEFLTWKVDSLRDFLTKRGLAKDGSKNELAALCFSAHKLKMPVIPTASEILKQNTLDYDNLLCIGSSSRIPDPLQLHENWVAEKNGICLWPPTYISDIIAYLTDQTSPNDLKAVLQDYKIGKAYEYFENGFLKEVFYNKITSKSEYCLLRCKCVPSQRVRDEPHNLWVCAEKATGQIMSSYCSCTAGLGRTCNHIAGLLFRIEAANKLGVSACTSASCTWNTPSKKDFVPTKIKDMTFKKSRHSQGNAANKRPLVVSSKQKYQPINAVNSEDTLQAFTFALKKSLPNACIFKGFYNPDKSTTRKGKDEEEMDLSKYFIENYLEHPEQYTERDVIKLEEITRGQSSNEAWLKLRDGRLTSSNFYCIHTGVLAHKADESYYNLIAKILGYKKVNPNIKSIKHGRETEPEAKKVYIQEMKSACHSKIVFNECGLFVDKNNPYLSASPDLLVSCDCCGLGVVEVKCPLVTKCSSCVSFCTCKIPDYLVFNGETCTYSLKKNHQYYAQVQGQLAISERKYCDFFVYTCNGTLRIRINFDEEYYTEIFNSLTYFFKHHIVPEIESRNIRTMFSQADYAENKENTQPTEAMDIETVYFCPICKSVVQNSDHVQEYRDQSICCDICDLWYHFRCVKMTKQSVSKLKQWTCPQCDAL